VARKLGLDAVEAEIEPAGKVARVLARHGHVLGHGVEGSTPIGSWNIINLLDDTDPL
jgi:hypothetical protein